MNGRDDEKFRELLRSAFASVADPELKRDLWPKMLRRLEEPTNQVPWFDWALVALLVMWFLFSPEAIPVLLYHL